MCDVVQMIRAMRICICVYARAYLFFYLNTPLAASKSITEQDDEKKPHTHTDSMAKSHLNDKTIEVHVARTKHHRHTHIINIFNRTLKRQPEKEKKMK